MNKVQKYKFRKLRKNIFDSLESGLGDSLEIATEKQYERLCDDIIGTAEVWKRAQNYTLGKLMTEERRKQVWNNR